MSVWDWSTSAGGNAAADAGMPLPIGALLAKDIDDRIRSLMQRVRYYADDTGGALVTGGTSNAYTVTTGGTLASYRVGVAILVRADRDNTGTATLNIDGLGAKPWKTMGNNDMPVGAIRQDRIYQVIYRSGTDAFHTDIFNSPDAPISFTADQREQLRQNMGFFNIGLVSPFAGLAAPSGWLFCFGQNVSRTTYADLLFVLSKTVSATTSNTFTTVTVTEDLRGLGLVGAPIEGPGIPAGATIAAIPNATTLTLSAAATATGVGVILRILPHGRGDGLSTFGLPDLRGRSVFGRDDMGGTAATRVTSAASGVNGSLIGGVGGSQLMQQHSHLYDVNPNAGPGAAAYSVQNPGTSGATFATQNAGTGGSQNMPPALILNYIIFTGV
jgi:microcystin-dependent protein